MYGDLGTGRFISARHLFTIVEDLYSIDTCSVKSLLTQSRALHVVNGRHRLEMRSRV